MNWEVVIGAVAADPKVPWISSALRPILFPFAHGFFFGVLDVCCTLESSVVFLVLVHFPEIKKFVRTCMLLLY